MTVLTKTNPVRSQMLDWSKFQKKEKETKETKAIQGVNAKFNPETSVLTLQIPLTGNYGCPTFKNKKTGELETSERVSITTGMNGFGVDLHKLVPEIPEKVMNVVLSVTRAKMEGE
jgi:hypothetical protein